MADLIHKLTRANMDIDLSTSPEALGWPQTSCPWNAAEGGTAHHCAIKNTSICPYFCGIEYLDTALCSYPEENPLRK
ncbi:MAG: hypothetical protein JW892_00960 [Anaerolineae bacterium]|nr:hypothetical protein [Anaerolineae bacterium]